MGSARRPKQRLAKRKTDDQSLLWYSIQKNLVHNIMIPVALENINQDFDFAWILLLLSFDR